MSKTIFSGSDPEKASNSALPQKNSSLADRPDLRFNYESLPSRVLFGVGRVEEVKQEVMRLDGRRVLILATEGRRELAEQVADLLGELCVGIQASARQHVPYETVEAAVAEANRLKIDLLVAPGGGSTIGLAKGIALESRLPIVAIPTTYAGSEMTHIWGISRNGRKTTGRHPIVKPKTVIYDPALLLTLPGSLSLTSGINAMAHAVEALYAENANPIASIMAEESIRQLAHSLPLVVANPGDVNGRSASLYGSWLAAAVLDQVGMALHHKLCHTLGGSYSLPHAETHTVVLPYAIAFNHSHAPDAMAAIARALGCNIDDVADTVQALSRQHGGPVSLQELGMSAADLDEASALATQAPYYNPRPVTREAIRVLLEAAYDGKRPSDIFQNFQ